MKSKNISVSLIRLYGGFVLLLLVITFTGCIFFAGSDTGIAIPNLTVKGAPSDITALSLRVTGPGMAPVESYYSSVPSSIEIEVPAGIDREFELIAYIGSSSPSAATSFKGTATADLAAGEIQNITLNMIVNETKLVIPDYQNGRIVQIDNISGGGWKEITDTDIGYPPGLAPYDIDFDSQGRIYIAISTFDSLKDFIIRIDDLDAVTYTPIIMGKGSPCVALTVDRKNSYLYYATSTTLYRCDLDGANDILLTTTGIITIRGLAVDENGVLYIAGVNGSGDGVFKYNPIAQVFINSNNNANLNTPWDVMVKSPYIYVARYDFVGGNHRIIKLNQELDIVDELPGKPDSTDDFHGPHRFVAILNNRIYIIDEDEGFTPDIERIVAIDDINGNNWDTFDPSSIGQSAFAFYSSC